MQAPMHSQLPAECQAPKLRTTANTHARGSKRQKQRGSKRRAAHDAPALLEHWSQKNALYKR
jgi:hypothetical protein